MITVVAEGRFGQSPPRRYSRFVSKPTLPCATFSLIFSVTLRRINRLKLTYRRIEIQHRHYWLTLVAGSV
jgi:hypothetical protein